LARMWNISKLETGSVLVLREIRVAKQIVRIVRTAMKIIVLA
jgi:hypothetical protein